MALDSACNKLNMYELEKEKYLGNTKNIFNNMQGIAVVETEYQNKVYDGWHSHNNAHITLFLRGGTSEKRKNYSEAVGPGSLLFYHSDELHLNHNTLFPSKNINIEIEENLLKELQISEAIIEKSLQNASLAKFLILKIFKESLVADAFSGDTINMLFAQLSNSVNHLEKFEKSPFWVKSLTELLNDCWNENPNLQDLAQVLQLNPITISKHFPKYFGCTLGEYMRRIKIDRSLSLIASNQSNLTEISFQCGFADQSHFIRTFKNQTGFLPKQFQKL
ncbi:AraC family transcriptional regulator [Flavobacterium sp. JLP]|uniref:AraC family transcriptional regulator n=1 Tax=unclassified Flavobacterium TaxID=196869 RepID=UPI00188B9B49|nr:MULTISPECIES: AraC family transcriptional regulator [unclassified Flavobacterium]MBF4492305.1 AraC family transcriptional regulator [Flavobacterium sp. MR2016-29]MBF4506416.1 AraC family transcriptional regulator [Flavobacterium sp. JLP]